MLTTMTKLAKRLNPLSRYERCWCLTLYRVGRHKAELCYAPADYEPREHVHENSDGEFLILWARNRPIYRKTHIVHHAANFFNTFRPIKAAPEDMGRLTSLRHSRAVIGPGDSYLANVPPWKLKTLSVCAGVPHAFRKGDSPIIWICFEKWKPGTKITSVAEDLVLT